MARPTSHIARRRLIPVVGLIVGMTAALLSLTAAPLARADIPVKAPLSGIIDRNGKPISGWESVVNNYVVRVTWAELQTSQGGAIVRPNKIDAAIANVDAWNANPSHTPPEAIKVRVVAG